MGCSGTGAAESAPSGPAQSTPTDTAPTPDGATTGKGGEGATAGCPDSVFITFVDLPDIAVAEPEPIADALGVSLPSAPLCTITWTDTAGEPSFTMFWKGEDFLDTYDALVRAVTDAGFQSVAVDQPGTSTFRKGEIDDLSVVAREPGPSKLARAVDGAVAAMYGPNVTG